MSNLAISDVAVGSFEQFVIDTRSRDLKTGDPEAASLSVFIEAWVMSGEGIRACSGDFQTYLIAVLLIIEHWHNYRDNALLDYVGDDEDPNDPNEERRITSIFRHNEGFRDQILDPQFFAIWRFYHLHPHLR